MTWRVALALASGAVLLAAPVLAQELSDKFSGTDLRDITVGTAVADLPSRGYADFSCASGDQPVGLAGFSDWRSCPAGDDGVRALRFGYDPASSRDGTVVAGHPAVLTALIGGTGVLQGLRIETDPAARPYQRKKAFLFGPQAQSHYGADGWSCAQGQPRPDQQPLGGVYLDETCTKALAGRALTVERRLYRDAGGATVNATRVTVLAASGSN